jgi:hypothetical protein
MREDRFAFMSEYEPGMGTRESNESAIEPWFMRHQAPGYKDLKYG